MALKNLQTPKKPRQGKKAVVKAQVVMRTTPQEFDIITAAANHFSMSKSDFLRTAIFEYIKNHQ